MHHNPVKRGLVTRPELWKWSSYRVYAFGEHGPVKMDWLFPPYVMRQGNSRRFQQPIRTMPRLFPRTLRKPRRVRHPHFGIATKNQKHDLQKKAVPPARRHLARHRWRAGSSSFAAFANQPAVDLRLAQPSRTTMWRQCAELGKS